MKILHKQFISFSKITCLIIAWSLLALGCSNNQPMFTTIRINGELMEDQQFSFKFAEEIMIQVEASAGRDGIVSMEIRDRYESTQGQVNEFVFIGNYDLAPTLKEDIRLRLLNRDLTSEVEIDSLQTIYPDFNKVQGLLGLGNLQAGQSRTLEFYIRDEDNRNVSREFVFDVVE